MGALESSLLPIDIPGREQQNQSQTLPFPGNRMLISRYLNWTETAGKRPSDPIAGLRLETRTDL